MKNPFRKRDRRTVCHTFHSNNDRVNGYTSSEVDALVTPVLGFNPDELCTLMVIGVRHTEGEHEMHILSNLTPPMRMALLTKAAHATMQLPVFDMAIPDFPPEEEDNDEG